MRKDLLGIVALAAVVAGVGWARAIGAAGDRATVESNSSATADVTLVDRSIEVDDLQVRVSLPSRPVVAMSPSRVRVRVVGSPGGRPLVLERGSLVLEMAMPMGQQRYRLIDGEDGWQEASIELPFCLTGNPRWYGRLEGTVAGRAIAASFHFDVRRTATAARP